MFLIGMFARQPLREFQDWQHRVCVRITLRWVYSSRIVAEFQEDVWITIPVVAERLKDTHWYVRKAAIEVLSRLAARGMC